MMTYFLSLTRTRTSFQGTATDGPILLAHGDIHHVMQAATNWIAPNGGRWESPTQASNTYMSGDVYVSNTITIMTG